MENPFDVDKDGKVNLRDARKALDESRADGSVKFLWGIIAGVIGALTVMQLWHFVAKLVG